VLIWIESVQSAYLGKKTYFSHFKVSLNLELLLKTRDKILLIAVSESRCGAEMRLLR
jgi:hypothetical protein